MENDLIRRGDVIAEFAETVRPSNNSDFVPPPTWNDAVNIVHAAPAVDAVEVVRCRECKHYKPSKFNSGTAHYCAVIDGFPVEEWYCAEGQRREDGDNGKHL